MQGLKSLGNRLTIFSGCNNAPWKVLSIKPVKGESLKHTECISIHHAPEEVSENADWTLTGVSSNARYVERNERTQLNEKQPKLGRPEATCAALIPIRKSPEWWEFTQEERRNIFETKSHHIAHSMHYLPAVARQLLHCRDLGEPFDFLTWFEYAPEHSHKFEDLVAHLRQTVEWAYVEREVDIRLRRA